MFADYLITLVSIGIVEVQNPLTIATILEYLVDAMGSSKNYIYWHASPLLDQNYARLNLGGKGLLQPLLNFANQFVKSLLIRCQLFLNNFL